MEYLIELQRSTDRPVYLVPHLMFFGKKPMRAKASVWDVLFGTELRPKALRRLMTLLKNPGKIFIELSEPMDLKRFVQAPENRNRSSVHLSLMVRRRLLVQLNRHRQSITGPALKSREELKESILTSDRLQETMRQFSEKRNIALYRVHREANQYIEEIAANYNNSVVEFGARVIRWFVSTMFDGLSVNHDMLIRIKALSRQGPLILVPCHKSHIDYLVLSYLLYLNNMPCPHVVAGKNLFFWPLGPLFRAGGAFSVRRSFKGAALYSKVFAAYVHKLLEEGFNLELFIEGGRSRTGKLLPPQLGFLSILLQAYKDRACEDMLFVPVYVGYDRVPEEKAYLHEIEGGIKEPENLKQMFRARRALKKKYGRIYVEFMEPHGLRDLLAQRKLSLQTMDQKQINELCRFIGNRIISDIGAATVVTPQALVASAMLSFSKNRLGRTQVMERVDILMTHLANIGATLSDTLLLDPPQAVGQAFHIYAQRKFIEPVPQTDGQFSVDPVYNINENRRGNLEYYKNSCVLCFVPAAFTALLILRRDAFQFSTSDLHTGYDFLQTLFKQEFPVDPEREPADLVAGALQAFLNDAILMPHPSLADTYNLTSAGFRKLGLFAQLLHPVFESYLVVLTFLSQASKKDGTAKDRIRKIQARAQRMLKSEQIERPESISKVNFQNALEFFSSQGIRGGEDADKIAPYMAALRTYLGLMSS